MVLCAMVRWMTGGIVRRPSMPCRAGWHFGVYFPACWPLTICNARLSKALRGPGHRLRRFSR